jgi:hypothetical protein|tara:strand:- start:275 stop:472 length:198 start_codon:yes stop_codon:yes gene_type:complete
MQKFLETNLAYNKIWFGLIFIGSVLNAVSQEIVVLNEVPYLSSISFLLGFVIGLVAHIRGKWLWV